MIRKNPVHTPLLLSAFFRKGVYVVSGMTITTTDLMPKPDKLCESSEHCTLVNTETKVKEIISKEYTCDDKTLLPFRKRGPAER